MDAKDFDLLYRSLDGSLSEDEERRLRLLLAVSPEARQERRRLQVLRTMLATRSDRSFASGFADRVMAGVGVEEEERAAAAVMPPAPSMMERLGWWLQEIGWTWRSAGWSVAVMAVVLAFGINWWLRPAVVDVPFGQTTAVSLPDGSNVELASGTTLTYRWRWGQDARRVELEGEAFFEVVDEERPFVVEAFNATVTVVGTRFNVAAWPDDPQHQTVVTVEDGQVEVAARRAAEPPAEVDAPASSSELHLEAQALSPERIQTVVPVVALGPGQATRIIGDSLAPRPPHPVDLDAALAWRSGALWFRNQPLEEIFRQLERRYATPIRATSPDVAARRHTYQNPTPVSVASVLSDICQALDLRYRRTARGYEVFSP